MSVALAAALGLGACLAGLYAVHFWREALWDMRRGDWRRTGFEIAVALINTVLCLTCSAAALAGLA